uniref:HEAT repeat-containing protein 1 n=1 Tax=Echinostoma caproni TaxID=27848 RepID=A0A183ANK5_9TREM
LLNEQTVADLFSIPDTCAPEHMTGWSAFLELVRSTAPAYSILHTLSIAVLNANFFHSLRGYPRPFGAHLFPTKSSPSLDLQHTGSGDAQLLLLSSLCDLANRDSPNYAATTALFDQLSLDLTHFDYLLLKLDASRPDVGDTERKPLLARVNEKRILSFEQQSAQTERTEHPTEDASSGSSDSESDNETGPSDQPILSLSTTISADLDADADLTRSSQSECPRTLLRQCCYRILVCLTAILAEANRHRPRAKRRATRLSPGFSITSPGVQTGAGESGMLASLLLATVNPVFHCLTVFPDWHALHQQVLLCIIELTNLCPVVLSQRLINLVQWTANNKQFMRLDNVHTLALLGRLVVVAVPALIRSSTDQTKAGLQVLLLFVDGMPNLANRLPRRRLAFYTGLVRGLAQVTGPLALDYASLGQSRSTGKADPKAKKAERQRQRELFSRWQENWVASWLWTMSLVFLNRNWTDESAANDVVPLLINLHGQFTWDTQVSAWYECLAFLSWLYKNAGNSIVAESEQSIRSKRCHTGTPNKKPELVDTEIAPPIKRRRTTSNSKSSGDIAEPDVKELPELICPANFNSPHITQSLLSILFHSGLEPDLVSNSSGPTLTSASTWALTGRAVQLLTTLLADPVYMDKIQQAASDPLGLGAVYGRLVEQSVQLMIGAAATLTKQKSSASKATSTPEDSTSILADGAKETLSGLQKVLIQIHDSVTGSIFVRMISDLFDTVDRGLRRKALELLAAKLTSLVVNCPPMPILDSKNPNALSQKILCRGKLPKRQPKPGLDLVLEAGLVQFTAQLASHYKLSESDGTKSITESGDTGKTTTGLFSSSFSRQSLACLRDLAKLLADRYPGEFSRTMDILISHPTAWWPVLPPSTEHKALDLRLSEIRGSGFAEARSLVCLFFVECLQRLPWQSMCPEASATTQRLRYLVRFALDHVITSCQLDTMPSLTLASLSNIQMAALVSGSVHSRDQHLQAGLTLLCNLMELAVVHGLVQSNSTTLPSSVISSSGARISWLDLDQSDQSTVAPGSLTSSYQLPQFIFRLSQIDLASATGANPERSSSTLRQVQELNKRMRILLPHLAEVHSTLSCVIRIAQFAQTNTDLTLIHGCLMFAREFAESICAAAESAKPGALSCAQLRHELIQYGVTQPDQLYNVLVSLLETCEYVLPHLSDPVPLLADLHTSVGALIAVLPLDSIVRFLQRLLDWTTSPVSPRDTVLRLTALFHILSDLHARLKAEDFVELSRQLSLVDYLVVAFTVAVGQKRKTVLKLSTRLNLKKCFELYVTGTESDGLKLAQAALTCAQRWLSAEHESNMCLDVASSGGSVLEFPISLIALLDTNASSSNHLPPLTEEQLVPTLNAFIEAASGDEALLRPMGCALSTRILHSTHWRTRLSAIRMLQKSFDYLTSGDQSSPDTAQHTGVAGCLVSDTLSALSEALEDDHPEVEAAANRLFAELERSGLTGNSKRTAM